MTKLYCGHSVSSISYGNMFSKGIVHCPECGQEWRGYKVISTDKGQAKRDLYFAMRLGERSRRRK